MKKKALLALLMAMTLLLSSCALIVKDEEVDASTVILKLGDTEYTKSQVIALSENVLYEMYENAYYSGTTLDVTNKEVIASARKQAASQLKQDMVLRAKIEELGFALTDEEKAEAKETAQENYDYAVSYVKAYMIDGELEGDELEKAVQDGLDSLGVSMDTYVKSAEDNLLDSKLMEYAVKDVTVSEDEIKAEYDSKVASDEEKYKENAVSWTTADRSKSSTLYYAPAGIRRVKQILLKFKSDDQTAITDAKSKVSEIKTKVTDAQKIIDNEESTDEELAAAQEALDAANAELEEANKALEEALNTGFANLDEEADAILAALAEDPDSWDKLMEEKNEDTGLQAGAPNAELGYSVCEGMTSFESSFVEAAMALKSVGDVSDKTRSDNNGYYIIKYVSDVAEGPADYESVKEATEKTVLSSKQSQVYTETVEQWIKDSGIKEDLGALND